jgi:tetratricopeptide (TPR) repeat protein
MDMFLRTLDPNLSRRRLRSLLYQASEEFGLELAALPHSFDTNELLEFAEKQLRRRDIRQSEFHPELLERTGIVQALAGDDESAERTYDRGIRGSERTTDEARFLYLKAHTLHFRRGEMLPARKLLHEAVAKMETQRHLKTRALLLLGRVERSLNDLEAAEEAYDHVLESGVLEFRPLALNYMSIVRTSDGEFDEAQKLNAKAQSSLRRSKSLAAIRQTEMQAGFIHCASGQYRAARKIFEKAVVKDNELLDLSAAGRAYNNLAVACSQLQDYEAARDACVQAIRCHTAARRPLLVAGAYQNLGRAFSHMGQSEPAMAAFERAVELAQDVGSKEREFEARTEALRNVLTNRRQRTVVPGLVSDCTVLLESNMEELPRRSLEEFSEVMGQLAIQGILGDVARQRGRRPRQFATDGGRRTLAGHTGTIRADEYDRQLASQLGDGLSGRYVPPVDEVASFLMLFTGDSFRFGEYAREFLLPTSRAKTQLKELCQRQILDMIGTRKAAKYYLSFHRG